MELSKKSAVSHHASVHGQPASHPPDRGARGCLTSFFPDGFESSVARITSITDFKDKPLSTRIRASMGPFQEGLVQNLPAWLGCGSMSPSRLLKTVTKVVVILTALLLLINWRYRQSSMGDSVRSKMARDLAVLHPSYKGPVFLHILAYQKTGSRFVAKVFDLHPDAFYIHDPLQMLYSSVFGIPADADKILPNNIFFDTKGNFRNLTNAERGVSLWLMDKLFHCRLSELPPSMLLSPYWATEAAEHSTRAQTYVTCLQKRGIRMDTGHEAYKDCYSHIAKHCPNIFALQSGYGRCGRILFYNGNFTTKDSDELWKNPNLDQSMLKHRNDFKAYFQCLSKMEITAKKCAIKNLDDVCEKKQYRVIKTTRSTMWIAEKLLRAFPNYRLIHMFRDPRGVTFSRLQSASPLAYAKFESPDAKSLSHSYCSTLYRDKVLRIRLQHTYFDRVIGLFYDKLVRNVTNNVNWLMEELHMKPKHSKPSVDFAKVAASYAMGQKDKWKFGLHEKDIKAIQSECTKLLRSLQLCFSGMRCIEYNMED